MAWLGSISYSSATAVTNTLIENLNKDIRTWGGNVDAGAYGLTNAAFATLIPGTVPASPANGMLAVDATNILRQYLSSAWSSAWNTASLQNSWAVQFGATASYAKDACGTVRFKGIIGNGTTPSASTPILLFTLPAGYRPSQNLYVELLCLSNTTVPWTRGTAAISINTDGTVKLSECSNNLFVSLDNVSFSIV